jgi:uncharacterized protein
MRILVICDDFYHPAVTPRGGLQQMQNAEFQFDFIENAHEWSAERMAQYPVVMLTKSNNVSAQDKDPWMNPAVEAAFVDYVRQGKGLLAVHSGTAVYGETTLLRSLLGGLFDHHPEQCPVSVEPLAGHALTAGSSAFVLKDEHYFMNMDDARAEVFLTTRSASGEQPGGWTRREGQGRVCVLTPGHNVEIWQHPSFQAVLANALRWCASGG